MGANLTDPDHKPNITVFYDGSCPLCRREIAFYRRRGGASRIGWRNISGRSAQSLPAGLSRDDAMARLHAAREDGKLLSGAAAFAEIWAHTPGFGLFRRLARRPAIRWILDKAYDLFLHWRPALQRFAS